MFSLTEGIPKRIFAFTKEKARSKQNKENSPHCLMRSEYEIVQELNVKHLAEIFATAGRAAMIAQNLSLILKWWGGSRTDLQMC